MKAGTILEWLKEDYGLGRGHGMALVHVIKNGPQIDSKHVGSSGVHRDGRTRSGWTASEQTSALTAQRRALLPSYKPGMGTETR